MICGLNSGISSAVSLPRRAKSGSADFGLNPDADFDVFFSFYETKMGQKSDYTANSELISKSKPQATKQKKTPCAFLIQTIL